MHSAIDKPACNEICKLQHGMCKISLCWKKALHVILLAISRCAWFSWLLLYFSSYACIQLVHHVGKCQKFSPTYHSIEPSQGNGSVGASCLNR